MVSTIVNAEDPMMAPSGGAAAEAPALIAFVAHRAGLSQGRVLTVLQAKFPHVAALLQAIPFSAETDELPTEGAGARPRGGNPKAGADRQRRAAGDQWVGHRARDGRRHALQRRADQDGSAGPDVFSSDVIPVLEKQRRNYDYLASTSKIDFLGPLVVIIWIIVILYGLLMVFLAWRPDPESTAGISPPSEPRVAPRA